MTILLHQRLTTGSHAPENAGSGGIKLVGIFANLWVFARRYFSIRSTEASVERIFSLRKRLANDSRGSRLDPSTFEAQVGLKMNFFSYAS